MPRSIYQAVIIILKTEEKPDFQLDLFFCRVHGTSMWHTSCDIVTLRTFGPSCVDPSNVLKVLIQVYMFPSLDIIFMCLRPLRQVDKCHPRPASLIHPILTLQNDVVLGPSCLLMIT